MWYIKESNQVLRIRKEENELDILLNMSAQVYSILY